MKVVVTGASGLFGHGLVQVLSARHDVVPMSHADADITDAAAVQQWMSQIRPNVIVHPAGIPDLDVCEAEPAKAFLVNYHGTRHVLEAAREVSAGFVYISTDAVFDGKARVPYRETAIPNPPTVYGRTKLRAERLVQSYPRHWIFRVSVLFGPGKTNFAEKGLKKIAMGEEYVVPSDQVASATYTLDAASKILEVIEAGRQGLYHLSNQGVCSRFDLARYAAELAGLDPQKVNGVPAAQMGRRAPRLQYAPMEMAALREAGFELPRPWQEALSEYVHAYWVPQGIQRAGGKD